MGRELGKIRVDIDVRRNVHRVTWRVSWGKKPRAFVLPKMALIPQGENLPLLSGPWHLEVQLVIWVHIPLAGNSQKGKTRSLSPDVEVLCAITIAGGNQ